MARDVDAATSCVCGVFMSMSLLHPRPDAAVNQSQKLQCKTRTTRTLAIAGPKTAYPGLKTPLWAAPDNFRWKSRGRIFRVEAVDTGFTSKNERNPRRLAANQPSYDSFATCSADIRACSSQIAAFFAAHTLLFQACYFCNAWAAARGERAGRYRAMRR